MSHNFNIHSPQYRKAFILYLRRGVPIRIQESGIQESRRLDASLILDSKFLDSTHLTTHYIWHTRGDGKVRSSHAANNGKIFAWDNPPPTGHPGEDYNCRCWAEPYNLQLKESCFQNVIVAANDGARWGWDEFFNHYFKGKGKPVTLPEIGHLQAIIDHARTNKIYDDDNDSYATIFERVEKQVFKKVRQILSGNIDDYFENSYSFYGVSWAHGSSALRGDINGVVYRKEQFLVMDVIVDYYFSDMFEDIFGFEPGTPYPITGYWKTRIEAVINEDENESQFK